MSEDFNWLIFGSSSPEPKFFGSRFNIGAAVLDLVAEGRGEFRDSGPISSALIEIGGRSVRLVKPNVVPEMVDDCLLLAKAKFLHTIGSVVVIYGDPDHGAGTVKLKRTGGSNGNRVVTNLLRYFDPNVVRIRVGMGRLPKIQRDWLDVSEKTGKYVLEGIAVAAEAVESLVRDGYGKTVDHVAKANKGKSFIGG